MSEVTTLEGLTAEQWVRVPAHGKPVPSPAGAEDVEIPTYYGLPALKPPPWRAYVPLYLYVGGVAGGGAVLGAVTLLDPRLRPLTVRARWLAGGALPVGLTLLTLDMHKPSRFLNMLRVFRPTSGISMGTWILVAGTTSSMATVVLPGRLADAASLVAGLVGTLLATYTGALLSTTAVPLWNRGRRSLPYGFAASAAGSAACLLLPLASSVREEQVLRRVLIGAYVAEEVAKLALEREVGPSHTRRSLTTGALGWLWTASKVLGAATVLSAATGRSRWLTAALGTATALAGRFAVTEAGKRSARDPRAAFEPERA